MLNVVILFIFFGSKELDLVWFVFNLGNDNVCYWY